MLQDVRTKTGRKPTYGHIFALEANVICNYEWKTQAES